jgi:phosphoglycolate phosphatase
MSTHPPIAVFDLDGTLADTIYDLVATLNVVLASEGLPALSLEAGRSMVGAGARALLERGLGAAGQEVTPARLDELHRAFMVHYAENLCVDTRLFPGVVEALDRLEVAGFRLAVCTNKYESHSVGVLECLGIAGRFAAIAGRDSFPYFKPDPRHLTLTLERAGGSAARAVMVGDSRTDIATAQAAGIPVVAVSFGYTDVPVSELGPDRVIDHYDELFEAVQSVMRIAA